jgi:hypothetical protein
VNRVLDERLRRERERILDLAGSGLWEGDLAEMRRDSASSLAEPGCIEEPQKNPPFPIGAGPKGRNN